MGVIVIDKDKGVGQNLGLEGERIYNIDKSFIQTPQTIIINTKISELIRTINSKEEAINVLSLYLQDFSFQKDDEYFLKINFQNTNLKSFRKEFKFQDNIGFIYNIVESIKSLDYWQDLNTVCIIQQIIKIGKKEKGLYGKLFTRVPQSGFNMPVGQVIKADGKTENLYYIPNDYPRGRSLFIKILEASRALEKEYRWPQEVDFIVKEDYIYICNSKDIEFNSEAKIILIDEFMKNGRMFRDEIKTRISKEEINYLYKAKDCDINLIKKIEACL